VRVVTWTVRRGPASLARTLYEDLTPQAPSSERDVAKVTSHRGLRPTKRDRRRLDTLRAESSKF
jgi:ribosome-associated heat shock protein Hsp15